MDDVEERVKQKQKKHKAKVDIVPFVSFVLYAPLLDLEVTFIPFSTHGRESTWGDIPPSHFVPSLKMLLELGFLSLF